MPLREVVVKRKRAGIVISTVTVIAVAGAATIIKGYDTPDTSPPVVRITAPAADQGLFSTATLAATCKDNVGCTSVVFKIDGDTVATATESPYRVDVDTTDLDNGAHTVSAVAVDAAANTTTAIPKTTEVVNGLGRVFVAENGDDSGVNCRRYASYAAFPADHTTVCATFIKANYVAGAGDVVLVADGEYEAQKICGGPVDFIDYNCVGSPFEGDLRRTAPAPVSFLGVTPHGATVDFILQFGQNNGSLSPIHMVVDGIDVKGHVIVNHPTLPGDYLFRNMHVYSIADQTLSSNGHFVLNSTHNVTIQNTEIGPSCCDFDGVQGSQLDGFTMEDSEVHDFYDSCRYVPSSITDDLGACSAVGFGDIGFSPGTLSADIDGSQTTITVSSPGTVDSGYTQTYPIQIGSEKMRVTGGHGTTTWTVTRGIFGSTPASHLSGATITYLDDGYNHVDGMHIWGGDVVNILRNQIWGIGANSDPVGQTIFLENDPVGQCLYFDHVNIVNNSIMVGNTNNNTVSIRRSGGAVTCTPGIKNVQILYNTVMNTRSDFSGGNISLDGLATGTSVVIAGNIARVFHGDLPQPPCPTSTSTGGTFLPTYIKNLVSKGGCGDTDTTGDATFTDANPLDPDMRLVANGQFALTGGENTYCPATDVVGNARPTDTPCAVGAYQG